MGEPAGRDIAWLPEDCTLPSAERPLRAAGFAGFFADTVRRSTRTAPTQLRLELEPSPQAAARAAELAAAEVRCCSFFTFTLTVTGQGITLDVTVPSRHAAVLDTLTGRANQP